MFQTPEGRLSGKIAVVTGSGRGIGRAIALSYAKEGADLFLVSRTKNEIRTVEGEIRDLGRHALSFPADLRDQLQVEATAKQIRKTYKRIDILVNNAGGHQEHNPILESNPDLWIADITLNLTSVYLVTRALLPFMVDAGGHIINVGSGMGHRPSSGNSAYHVGKAGLWMLTRCLAEEVWENKINVNELIPGPVATKLTEGRMKVGGPPPFASSERVKSPQEVANLALWLAIQPSSGPTAQSFSLTRRPI